MKIEVLKTNVKKKDNLYSIRYRNQMVCSELTTTNRLNRDKKKWRAAEATRHFVTTA